MKMQKTQFSYFYAKAGTKLLFSLTLFVSLISFTAISQKNKIQEAAAINFIQIEKELSGQYVSSIVQGKKGFLWIGTQDGLYRFDGNNTKSYKYNPVKESLPGTWIRTIAQDTESVFWLGINGFGLVRFDSEKNSFKMLPSELGSLNEHSGLTVLQTVCSKLGDIWIRTEKGVFKKNKTNEDFIKVTDTSPSIIINETDNGKVLIAKESTLFSYQNSTNKLVAELNNVSIEHLEPTIKDQIIYKSDSGLFEYNLESKVTKKIEIPEKINIISNFQKSIIYFLGKSKLYRYNTDSGVINALNVRNFSLKINDVKTLFIDSDDVLWVGSRKGLYKQNVIGDIFKETIPLHARGIIVDDTHVYIAGRNGFHKFDKEKKSITPIIKETYFLSVYKSSDGFWLGDLEGNMHFVDFNGNVTVYDTIIEKQTNPIRDIYGIVEDKNGFIWVGSWVGLHLINKNKEFVQTFSLETQAKERGVNTVKLYIDKKGTLWITTVGNGIYKIPKASDISAGIKEFDYKQYVHKKGDNSTINSNVLYEIIEKPDGALLFGTNYGINQYFEETDSFQPFMKNDKLLENNVMSLQIDKENLLWISTIRNGIFINDLKTNQYFNLNQKDGLISNAYLFNSSAFHDNKLYFGTEDNVQVINSENLIYPKIEKSPLITDLNVYGRDEVASSSILNNKELKLNYNESNFTIRFQLLDFRFSDKVNYFYKIKEIQSEWRRTKDNTANFTNLQPGKYHFLLKATYQSKLSEIVPESSMTIIISPPWYKTWWAYMFYSFALISLILLLHRFNLNRKLAIAEKQKTVELNRFKSKMYANITHEFRTPLTVILGMTQNLKKSINKIISSTDKNALTMIERNGESLLEMVNEMLDLAKIENNSMELTLVQADAIPLVKYLSESFHSLAEAKQINLTVYSEINALEMDIDVNKMASIISNLLSNAIKFTSANGKIIVHLNKIETEDGQVFSIKVQDNGLGLSEDNLTHLFDRFYQADNQSLQYQEGTGIGLSLVKEFVELMSGTIRVESTLGKGSTFTVQLPVSNTAVKTVDAKINVDPPLKKNTNLASVVTTAIDETSALPLALIIEDNEDVAHYLRTCLKGKYQIIHASNGNIGIEMAYEKIPDIIISDVMMPGKDGFEVCSILKSDVRTDHIPIILLTAKVTTEDRLTGLSHGADAYLAKPFNEKELFIRLDQLLLLRKKLVDKIQKDGLNTFMAQRPESPETIFLQKVIQFINEDISNSDFGSSDLANKLHLSESQIYRKLKAITDKSTAVFIRSIRLQKAKDLIETTDKTISEIAYETGFNDPSWFSRAFKEEFGFAPSEIHK